MRESRMSDLPCFPFRDTRRNRPSRQADYRGPTVGYHEYRNEMHRHIISCLLSNSISKVQRRHTDAAHRCLVHSFRQSPHCGFSKSNDSHASPLPDTRDVSRSIDCRQHPAAGISDFDYLFSPWMSSFELGISRGELGFGGDTSIQCSMDGI